MSWNVVIHPLVFQEDFKKIDLSAQQILIRAIRKKLTLDPESFGSRLRGEFHGYWKLRVGEYRVIYKIEKGKIIVKVIQIGIRRDFEVYQELAKRIPKILNF